MSTGSKSNQKKKDPAPSAPKAVAPKADADPAPDAEAAKKAEAEAAKKAEAEAAKKAEAEAAKKAEAEPGPIPTVDELKAIEPAKLFALAAKHKVYAEECVPGFQGRTVESQVIEKLSGVNPDGGPTFDQYDPDFPDKDVQPPISKADLTKLDRQRKLHELDEALNADHVRALQFLREHPMGVDPRVLGTTTNIGLPNVYSVLNDLKGLGLAKQQAGLRSIMWFCTNEGNMECGRRDAKS